MNMKKYATPELEQLLICSEDILTLSDFGACDFDDVDNVQYGSGKI